MGTYLQSTFMKIHCQRDIVKHHAHTMCRSEQILYFRENMAKTDWHVKFEEETRCPKPSSVQTLVSKQRCISDN